MHPTTPYAAGKAAADLMALSFYNVLNLDIAIIRPFNNYGPRQNDQQLAAIIPLTALGGFFMAKSRLSRGPANRRGILSMLRIRRGRLLWRMKMKKRAAV